jgi:hypothetical protein
MKEIAKMPEKKDTRATTNEGLTAWLAVLGKALTKTASTAILYRDLSFMVGSEGLEPPTSCL